MLKHARMLSILIAGAFAGGALAQTPFTQWDFDATGPVGPVDDQGLPTDAPYFGAGAIYNSPAPTLGSGIATPLGMDNNYTFATNPVTIGSVAYCDVLTTAGVGTQSTFAINVWRIRGPSNAAAPAGNGNGWNRSAPERTQGAQFTTSTVGYSGIHFGCQFYSTTQGVSTARTQYTTDGTTWTDIGSVIRVQGNDFLSPPSGPIGFDNYGVNIDFSSIPAVNNNPNFGVRIVSVYDPNYGGTAQVPAPSYASAAGLVPPATNITPYNNSSGNWRYGAVTFSGTASGPINPVLRATSSRAAVCTAEANTVTLNVVVQPGTNPTSTGTTMAANLSQIGGSSSQTLTGNQFGTFFTYTATIPANTVAVPSAPVTKTVTFTATDAQGRQAVTTAQIVFVNCTAANSTSTVVISQVYGGGGNTDALNQNNQGVYDSDFVEIYNRSASPVNLNGWSVQYASPTSSGGFNNPSNQVNLSGTIQSHQYMLIRFSDPFRGFAALPTPDFSTVYGSGGLGNDGGRVVLSSSTAAVGTATTAATVKDLVGYGSASLFFEGAGPAFTPDNAHAVIRKGTTTDTNPGAQDTNQNFNDFVVAPPLPHNRASNGTTSFLTAYASVPNSNPDAVVVTNSACAGSVINFNVAVTPGTSSTGIAVSADVSPITGVAGSVALFDDGTHGDVQAGDNIFSLAYTVPSNTTQGVRSVTFTATDAQSGVATAALPLDIGTCVDSGARIVIYRVFGGGAHYDYVPNMDFCQILNRSNVPVDLTGWNLQYADANGDFASTKVVNLSGMIGPGETRLIAPQPVPGIGLQLPAPDFAADLPGFGFDNHYGRVAIVHPIAPATTAAILVATGAGSGVINSAGVEDLVGYGSATPTYEGVAPTGTLANGTFIARKGNGTQDFNQNIIDFDVAYILTIPRTTRTLSITKTSVANGTGTVTSDLSGINCGATCSGIFDRDTILNLTATPSNNSKFTGWSGACSGIAPCQVTLTDSASVTATFGCKSDFNNVGGTNVQDIFDFLAAWFAGNATADVNGIDGLNVQDIFDFLSYWFAGC